MPMTEHFHAQRARAVGAMQRHLEELGDPPRVTINGVELLGHYGCSPDEILFVLDGRIVSKIVGIGRS